MIVLSAEEDPRGMTEVPPIDGALFCLTAVRIHFCFRQVLRTQLFITHQSDRSSETFPQRVYPQLNLQHVNTLAH